MTVKWSYPERMRLYLLPALAVSLPGCFPETREPLSRRWESEHFIYRSRPDDDTVAEAVLDTLERHLELFQKRMGEMPLTEKIVYRKYLNARDLELNGWSCGNGDASACAFHCANESACETGTIIENPRPLDPHELTHAYTQELGFPPLALTESLAWAYSCDVPSRASDLWSIAGYVPAVSQAWQAADIRYADITAFVVWLLDNRSAQSFTDWYARTPSDATLTESEATFEEAYGESLAELWELALSSAQRNHCIPLLECESPRLEGEALLAAERDGRPAARLLPETEQLLFDLDGSLLNFLSCEDALPMLTISNMNDGAPWFWSSAGHRFAAVAQIGSDWTVTPTTLTSSVPSVSSNMSCADGPVYVLNETHSRLLLPPVGTPVNVVTERFDQGERRVMWLYEMHQLFAYTPMTVSVCGPCNENGSYSCTPLSLADDNMASTLEDAVVGQWLRFENATENGVLFDFFVD